MDGQVSRDEVRQRATVIAELPALLAELGVDAAEVFEGTAVTLPTLDAETRIPFGDLAKILDRSVRLSGRPELGLLLGRRFRLEHHGAVGELMRTAPTLGAALRSFVACQPGYSSGAVVYLHSQDGMTAFGNAVCSGEVRPGRTYSDLVVGIGMRMITLLTGGQAAPVEFHMSCGAPADRAPYLRILAAPVRFQEPLTCMYLPAEVLALPLPGSNAARHERLAREIAAVMAERADPGLGTRVRGALRKLLLVGKPTMEAVAGELTLHPRTLRRRLKEDGLVFDTLRDEVRLASALELLELTDLPVGEVAATLSYASPEVFAEAFRRMRGCSPREWRARHARKV
ncbi:AraC family transcriptional regulator [Gemmobacter aquaticus]|uniref:AraC family transcriptional regulator n=1 Tax=Gemmobacter aquaticus TaxID=490185 RepID=A0A917YL15_9RHOB|nr:AraC family transcriptional regulator [Gemmobacter aquaticus]GGO34324.1 AraC family transcriptional regulator [Gemmobacter aquaticus]